MKIIFVWFIASALVSIVLIIEAPNYLPVGNSMADAIKLSSELELLKLLMETEELNKEILQTRYKELHKNYKQSVVSSQLEGMSVALLFSLLTVINMINIIVVIGYWIYKSNKKLNLDCGADAPPPVN